MTATSSAPTLVSSRQPCHSAVTVPGRSASQTAPSMAAAAMTNQMSVRRMVIGSTRRAKQRHGMGRELVDAAFGGEMGFSACQPGRGGLGGLRRQRLHDLDGLGEVAAIEGGFGAGKLCFHRIALHIADPAQRDDALELAQEALA